MPIENVRDFFIRLSQDPYRLSEYKKDPDSVIRAQGFAADETAMLLTRDPARIRAFFGMEALNDIPFFFGGLAAVTAARKPAKKVAKRRVAKKKVAKKKVAKKKTAKKKTVKKSKTKKTSKKK